MYKVVFVDDAGPGRVDGPEHRNEADASDSWSLPFRLLTGYALADPQLKTQCEIVRVPLGVPGVRGSNRHIGRQVDSSVALSTAEQVISNHPDMIAVSLYVWNSLHALQVLGLCRQMSPGVMIVAGGPSTLGQAETILQGHPAIDVAIAGEGEEAFRQLLRCCCLREGGLNDVPFAVFRDGVAVRASERGHWIADLDSIPSAIVPFTRAEITRDGICHFEAARGCPNRCIYCQYSRGNRTFRSYSLDRILADLAHMRAMGVDRVSFVEPSFALDGNRALAILNYLEREYVECRIIVEVNLDQVHERLLEPLRRLAGAGRLFCVAGVQSTHDETLALVGRRNDLTRLRRTASVLFGQEQTGECNVMAGLPGDRFTDVLASLDAAVRLLPGLRPTLFPVMVLPGTPLRESAASLGVVYDPLPPYYVLKTRTLSAADMQKAWILSRMGTRLIEPVVLLAMTLGIDWPAPYQEVFDEACFAYTERYGYGNPAADVFFIGAALRRALLPRTKSATERIRASEYIDLLALLGPEFGAATPEALLQFPTRVLPAATSVQPEGDTGAGPAPGEVGPVRPNVRVFHFRQFARLQAHLRSRFDIDYQALPGENAESAYGFLAGDRTWFLSPGVCRSLLQAPARIAT